MNELIARLYAQFLKCPVVTTDSRKIDKGCLFFGLTGQHSDGSAFGAQAVDQGAGIAIVRHGACPALDGVIFVDDPLTVLQQLSEYHRSHLRIPVIAITGSNGKTTTKELVHRVLASAYTVRATQGNLNNHIGVPLTLLSIQSTDQIAVVEMGANHLGEIRLLCALARPTHGIVTNIGKAHLEGFGGLEGIKQGKSELYESLEKNNGIAFINRDELYLAELSAGVHSRVFYGFGHNAAYVKNAYHFAGRHSELVSTVQFYDAKNTSWTVTSNLYGAFNLPNIATAIAVGLFFNVDGDAICRAIASYDPDNNRAQRISIGSNLIILDAYNANPTSMAASIDSFQSIHHPNKFMILGNMLELGFHTDAEHEQIARHAQRCTDTQTIFVGAHFQSIAARLQMPWYADINALMQAWRKDPPVAAVILIKGSRAVRLESLLAALQ